jgi:hypothetical protein
MTMEMAKRKAEETARSSGYKFSVGKDRITGELHVYPSHDAGYREMYGLVYISTAGRLR